MPHCAIFADTQDEPASVYKWLDWLETKLPFPVHRVTAAKLSEAATRIRVSANGNRYFDIKLPAFTLSPAGKAGMISMRNCTEDFKILPIRREMLKVARISPRTKDVHVIQWIGISTDEAHRMKSFRGKWAVNRWPLIDLQMKRRDCLKWMQAHGFPEPPRSACIYCPFHHDNQWREIKNTSPAEFDQAVQLERRLNEVRGTTKGTMFFHASRVPLDQVDLSTDIERGQGMLAGFGNECEGMCGV